MEVLDPIPFPDWTDDWMWLKMSLVKVTRRVQTRVEGAQRRKLRYLMSAESGHRGCPI